MSTGQIVVLLGLAVLAFGGLFLLIGFVRSHRARGWRRATGVVVSRRTGRPEGAAAIHPTFQWRDQQGQVHQHTSSFRQSFPPRPGQQVPVRYDPDDPSRAMIDSFVQSGRIFYVVGAAILVVGFVVLAQVYAFSRAI